MKNGLKTTKNQAGNKPNSVWFRKNAERGNHLSGPAITREAQASYFFPPKFLFKKLR